MDITLSYGQKGLTVTLPDDWPVRVIRKKPMPVLPDPGAGIETALTRPIDGLNLAEAAAGCRSACILICDITRPVPNHLVLPPVIRTLITAGLDPGNITVLVATGLHRPNLGEELRELIGDDRVLDTVQVVNHYARRDEDHLDLGRTRRGTPVKLDRRLVRADLKIVTGLVEPHFMAGYSGGRKVIVPGVAHQQTITFLHTAAFLEDPLAANCILDRNPLHEEQLEIVRGLGPVYAVNTVIDENRRLSYVNFGLIEPSHQAAVEFMRAYTEIPVNRRFRTIITTSAGYPLDATYYQTVKGMVGAADILEPGGRLFIASACSSGLGSPEYVQAQERLVRLGPEAFLRQIQPKKFADIDEWQTEMQLRPMRQGGITLFTDGLSPEEKLLTGVDLVDDFTRAVEQWVSRCGDTAVAVIPEGPYVAPRYRPEAS